MRVAPKNRTGSLHGLAGLELRWLWLGDKCGQLGVKSLVAGLLDWSKDICLESEVVRLDGRCARALGHLCGWGGGGVLAGLDGG